MRVALYARVSDDKKKEDGERRQDIECQVKILQESFNLMDGDSLEIYRDDGKSAFTDDINQRPAFKKLITDIRRGHVKQIYIEDMTRFSRNLSLGLQWLAELGSYGATVTSLKEGELEVTSSRGWMQSTLLLMFAEWDSRVKSEKVKSGMAKARNLRKHIGRPKKKGGSETSPVLNGEIFEVSG